MQRGNQESARGPGSKRSGGGGKRSVGRVLSVVCSPIAVVALFAALLLYSSHRFYTLAHNRGGDHADGFIGHGIRGGEQQLGGGSTAGGEGAGTVAQRQQLQQQQHSQRKKHNSWLTAALMWAEEHHAARIRAKTSSYQLPTGCGMLPCQGDRLQRPPTLVLYVYMAADAEQQRNFEFFMKHGVEEQADWLTYRVIMAAGTGILQPHSLPPLPRNAAYVRTSRCTTGVWGILSVVASDIAQELTAAEHIIVVTSAARGPFMPPYTKQYMHWTDALTSKFTKRTKLVGSALTCEGAPKDGDAADEWRRNPFILPSAWAVDKEGWQLLSQTEEVFKCHPNPWAARYHSDSGASLALLSGGYNIDTLLAKYQGVDWWNQRTWDCNARVRPDAEWTYDGISITPYETVFVPVSQGPAQSDWSYVRHALKYSVWLEAQTSGVPQGNSNSFVSDAWTLRAPRLIYANSRGPGCFDFDFYVQHNPDLASKSSMHQMLWEHYVLIGQFQGRPHRFTCPVQIGNSYRSSYLRARGRRCFDHNYYAMHNQDLRMAGMNQAHELFNHYADFGQFENRLFRYICSDSLFGLPKGYDSRQLDPLPKDKDQRDAARWQGLVEGAAQEAQAGLARLQGHAAVAGGGAAAAAGAAGGGDATSAAQQQQQAQQQQAQAAAAAAAAEQQAQGTAAAVAAEQHAADATAAAADADQAAAATAAQAAAAQAAGGAAAASQEQQVIAEGQQAAAAAGSAADVQQAQALAGGEVQEAVGDAAADGAAFGRMEESEAEAFQQQEQVQAAAGGA